MTTKDFIQTWNAGGHAERCALVSELGLQDKHNEVMVVPTNDGSDIESFHFIAFPHLRAGAWYAKDNKGEAGYMTAFRLYPRGMQTWNSFNRQITEKNRKWAEGFKTQFCVAFNNIVAEETADN